VREMLEYRNNSQSFMTLAERPTSNHNMDIVKPKEVVEVLGDPENGRKVGFLSTDEPAKKPPAVLSIGQDMPASVQCRLPVSVQLSRGL
jgi:hypothetical protein